MKVHLLYNDRDPNTDTVSTDQVDGLTADLIRDLGLGTVLDHMSDGDRLLRSIATRTMLTPLRHPEEVRYRQQVFADCLQHPGLIAGLYQLATEALDSPRRARGWMLGNDPPAVLHRATEVLAMLLTHLRALRALADEYALSCGAAGLQALFAGIHRELPDSYFPLVEEHLRRLEFPTGVIMTATLGPGCHGTGYVLRKPATIKRDWRAVLLGGASSPGYTYRIAERDQAGAQALGELRNQGINLVADAVAQSVDHIMGFFTQLRWEAGFYLGCAHLHQTLGGRGIPVCQPDPRPAEERVLSGRGVRDVVLALRADSVVGNDLDADGATLIMITGANQGGKSTLLRSLGLAQLMLGAGMFVAADSYRASLATGLYTHYTREEDAGMDSGKFDEELARMSRIVDRLSAGSMVLLNESFASTNDREGSQVARHIVEGLRGAGVRVLYVTHLFDLAHGLARTGAQDAVFLRPERLPDQQRTYRVVPGEPLPTSYGPDLYQRVFGSGQPAA